jgi:transposase-like protein
MLAKKLGDFTVEVGLLGQKPSAEAWRQGDQPWLASPLHRNGPVAKAIPLWPAWPVPNPDCCDFNSFGAENLSMAEWIGKHEHIRRLYCSSCGYRFSERQGTLLRCTRISEQAVVRVVKCLGHGCSIAAAADICDLDSRTVARLLEQAGRRSADCRNLQRARLVTPPEVVQLDELHGRVSPTSGQKGGRRALRSAPIAARDAPGPMRRWRSSLGS